MGFRKHEITERDNVNPFDTSLGIVVWTYIFFCFKSNTVFPFTKLLTVDGAWSEWSQWTDCNTTCDNGTRSRSRECDNPAPNGGGIDCIGSSVQTELCETGIDRERNFIPQAIYFVRTLTLTL